MTTKEKWAVAFGVSAVAATALGISRAITSTLTKEALDREEPAVMRRMKGKIAGTMPAPDSDFLRPSKEAAEVLRTAPLETVETESHDGLTLVGHWDKGENPKRILLAMHGWRSTWYNDFGSIAPFWKESGCAVLFAEQRGQGQSGGEHMGFGTTEYNDCMTWIQWINEHGGAGLPIYLIGLSMGATTVLMASSQPFPDNVRGIIADCGFTSPHAIWKHVMEDNLHLPYHRLRQRQVETLFRQAVKDDTANRSTVDALKECTLPVLFIHGTDDGFVPVGMTYENYKACAGPRHLLIVPGADHACSYLLDGPSYRAAVLSFWDQYDQQ